MSPPCPRGPRAPGRLTWEPWSNQKPSHQLLKAELPIIRRKRDTVKTERTYPARRGTGPGTGLHRPGCWEARASSGPRPAGKCRTCKKRPPHS